MIRSGREENLPYSLSRWTDLPAAKWPWFQNSLAEGKMEAFDPRTGIPSWWSLDPKETLGMVFWTKNPENLIVNADLLKPYRVKVHMTLTGWHEAERGVPSIERGIELLKDAVKVFGKENVYWRFSPIPLLPLEEVARRYAKIAGAASDSGLDKVYLAFLQTNDLMAETRDHSTRLEFLTELWAVNPNLKVLLCNEDRTLSKVNGLPEGLGSGVCAPPEDFGLPGHKMPPSEGCGCVLMVDPFTVNETCVYGCAFCYAHDRSLSAKKRNTTKKVALKVLR